jgi:hypothetical protein
LRFFLLRADFDNCVPILTLVNDMTSKPHIKLSEPT